MSTRRADEPPIIAGFEYRSVLGIGGFATVFLYEQLRPRREVAIKVLTPDTLDAARRAAFEAEADRMAGLSGHPYIVTIYGADVADDGRPYLVMEYYPGPNLAVRVRHEQISVPEALRLGANIASAVETAHRAGVLHRDIKPANVLTSRYDRPGLTDFGISATQSAGMPLIDAASVPWAPPEAFVGGGTQTAASDIYSLGALVYHALAGRSPFEDPAGANSTDDLIARITGESPRPIGRADVPPELEAVLIGTMDPRPQRRPASALDFAVALQGIESAMGLAVTPLDVPGVTATGTAAYADEAGESTLVRGAAAAVVASVVAAPEPPAPPDPQPATPDVAAPEQVSDDPFAALAASAVVIDPDGGRVTVDSAEDRTVRSVRRRASEPTPASAPAVPPAEAGGAGATPPALPPVAGSGAEPSPSGRRRVGVIVGVVAAGLVLGVGGAAAVAMSGGGSEPEPVPAATSAPPSTPKASTSAPASPTALPSSAAPSVEPAPQLSPSPVAKAQATATPTPKASAKPKPKPATRPSSRPAAKPTTKPAAKPTSKPAARPKPTTKPKPTAKPKPTTKPKPKPSPSRSDAFGDSGVDM
jgi:eukaryotic-like serine/threonine-protein kinase